MTPNEHYPHLFEPMELAGRRLRNRIAHASITTLMSAGQRVTEREIRYLANRARGGAAMIVTEPLGIAPHQGPAKIRVWDDHDVDGMSRLADAVESEDCRLLGQVQDPGRGRHAHGRNPGAIGASAQPCDLSFTVPHVLTVDEIRQFVEHAAGSAARLKRCGFSGVELSSGHGHLFHQFLSPQSNHRDDGYGGDLAGRARLVVEICQAIRAACGSGFIIGVKLPGDDGVPGGVDPALAARIARHLVASVKVDYLTYAQGAHHRSLEKHVPNDSYPRLPYVAMIEELAKVTPDVPVMALGRITDPAEAEGILARGRARLVGLGRPLIADPAWPLKAARGRARDIRYCVNGNDCWGQLVEGKPLACDNNPRVAQPDEVDFWPRQVAAPRRVVVVGAGIAGLEAAWVAAARGHRVTVLGASREVGGKARLHVQLPGSESISSVYDYQFAAGQRAGVRFELGSPASLADVRALSPDVVVLATGASMIWPLCLPEALRDEGIVPDLRSAMRELVGHRQRQRQSGTAVIYDMDHTEGTYASAELLAAIFDEVVVLTPREQIAEDTALVTRQGIVRRAYEKGIRIERSVEPRWTDRFERDGTLEFASVYGGAPRGIDNVQFFAYSTPRTPDDALAAPLRAAGIEVRLVGDCQVARGVLDATATGHAAGMEI